MCVKKYSIHYSLKVENQQIIKKPKIMSFCAHILDIMNIYRCFVTIFSMSSQMLQLKESVYIAWWIAVCSLLKCFFSCSFNFKQNICQHCPNHDRFQKGFCDGFGRFQIMRCQTVYIFIVQVLSKNHTVTLVYGFYLKT